MWRTVITEYLHVTTQILLKDRTRCSLDNLKINDHIILIQRYKDKYGIYHTFETLGVVVELSEPLYTNLFIHFTDHDKIDICALRLKTSRNGRILHFKETNTYQTINDIKLDMTKKSFTIESIATLYKEPFKKITISYPIHRMDREIVHTLIPIGILALIDQYIFDY